jgi:inner membrane protein involved in colicin E2 resistance
MRIVAGSMTSVMTRCGPWRYLGQVIANRRVRSGKRRALTASVACFAVAVIALFVLVNAPDYAMLIGVIAAVSALAGVVFALKNVRLHHNLAR